MTNKSVMTFISVNKIAVCLSVCGSMKMSRIALVQAAEKIQLL